MNRCVFISAFFLVLSLTCQSTTIHVPQEYQTIQQAIDAAVNNDTVLISPGTYFENLSVSDKNIIIGSLFLTTRDTNYISQTILDGNQVKQVLTFESVDSPSLISGLTITHGKASFAGGIYVNASVIRFEYVRIIDNLTECGSFSQGGGIGCANSDLTMDQFRLINNTAHCTTQPINPEGGGLYAYQSTVHLTNGEIADNHSYLGGGMLVYVCTLSISNVRFSRNNAPYPGSAIAAFDSDIDADGCVFDANIAGDGTIYTDLTELSSYNLSFINCVFTGNSEGLHIFGSSSLTMINCTVADNFGQWALLYGGPGDINILNSIFWNAGEFEVRAGHPNTILFLGYSDFKNGIEGISTNGTFALTGPIYNFTPEFTSDSIYLLTDYSPCIGAGIDSLTIYPNSRAPEFDIDSNLRPTPAGSMPDLGAYENSLANPLTGFNEPTIQNDELSIFAYPNPAIDEIHVRNLTGQTIVFIEILDIYGRKVRSLDNIRIDNGTEYTIFSGKSEFKGIYTLRCRSVSDVFPIKIVLN